MKKCPVIVVNKDRAYEAYHHLAAAAGQHLSIDKEIVNLTTSMYQASGHFYRIITRGHTFRMRSFQKQLMASRV